MLVCNGCSISIDDWPPHSHQWIEGNDVVYCREIGGQFEIVAILEEAPDLPCACACHFDEGNQEPCGVCDCAWIPDSYQDFE